MNVVRCVSIFILYEPRKRFGPVETASITTTTITIRGGYSSQYHITEYLSVSDDFISSSNGHSFCCRNVWVD
jgi:hypothetical protein